MQVSFFSNALNCIWQGFQRVQTEEQWFIFYHNDSESFYCHSTLPVIDWESVHSWPVCYPSLQAPCFNDDSLKRVKRNFAFYVHLHLMLSYLFSNFRSILPLGLTHKMAHQQLHITHQRPMCCWESKICHTMRPQKAECFFPLTLMLSAPALCYFWSTESLWL